MKRIFDASCIDVFLIKGIAVFSAGFRTTIASLAIAPFLVPPKERMSMPASVVNSLKPVPSAAAALEIRAPSKWTIIPSECAYLVIALISSIVYKVPSSVD